MARTQRSSEPEPDPFLSYLRERLAAFPGLTAMLHHLSDTMVAQAVNFVRRVVKPGGVFVSIDPCYVPGQHVVAKLINDHDRGQYIRDPAGFERIISGLGQVHTTIYSDLLRIPYTQIVMRVEVGAKEFRGSG